MSTDNGIYILKTAGPEFRVIHGQAIDNIYGSLDENGRWIGDPEMIRAYFNKSVVYNNQKDALAKAVEMSKEYEYLEYGISLISDFEDKVFIDL